MPSGIVKDSLNTYMTYVFIKKLTTPFEDWPAFSLGLIDKNGKVLKARRNMTDDERADFPLFDLMVLNLKKLIAKLPAGDNRIATFGAALFLLKDGIKLREDEIKSLIRYDLILEKYMAEAKVLLENEGSAPTNMISTGAVAVKNDQSTILNKILRRKKVDKNPNL